MQTLHLNVASVCADPDDSGILRTRVNLEHVSPDNWPAIARLVNAAPELLEALRKSGCCLSVLEDVLMDDDVIYDK